MQNLNNWRNSYAESDQVCLRFDLVICMKYVLLNDVLVFPLEKKKDDLVTNF